VNFYNIFRWELFLKPPCFLHFLPCLHMALSYQTVSKTLT
jgi:hypothetical protein